MQRHNAQPLLLECLSARTAKSRLENQALNCQSIARLAGKMLPVVDELALEVQFWVVLWSPISHMGVTSLATARFGKTASTKSRTHFH